MTQTYVVPKTVLATHSQVFQWRAGDEDVWVKKRRRRKNPLGWWMQRAAHGLTGLLLALPPERSAEDNVRLESGLLGRMAEAGVRVPRVLHVDGEYFVMTDAGPTLEIFLDRNPALADEYIVRAARALRRLHDLGLAHGGAQIKNMTVRDGEIGFIDFESPIPRNHLEEHQLRDLFLFLLSLERAGRDPDLAAVCRAYGGDDAGRTRRAVCGALMQLRLTRVVERSVFSRLRLNDIRGISRLVRKAETQ